MKYKEFEEKLLKKYKTIWTEWSVIDYFKHKRVENEVFEILKPSNLEEEEIIIEK